MKAYRLAKKRINVSVGESVRILRELQELSQSQLARLTGIPQATISAIENRPHNSELGRTVLCRRLRSNDMSTIEKGRSILTLINIFTVSPEKQQELVTLLIDFTQRTRRHLPHVLRMMCHSVPRGEGPSIIRGQLK